MKELSTGPWKVAIGTDEAMENWMVASLGASQEHNDETVYVTTDHVHASEMVCYPYEDAEFIVACRNYALSHGHPLERIEAFTNEVEILNDICERKQERLDRMERVLRQFAECDLNDGNCASLEVATKRIRNLAKSVL